MFVCRFLNTVTLTVFFVWLKNVRKKNLWHMFFVTLAGQSFYLLLRSASESVGLKLS